MIKTIVGDLLSIKEGIIVHGCNGCGVMNSGIARQVKEQFPQVFGAYQKQYISPYAVGSISNVKVADAKFIVNAITQRFYGADGKRYVNYEGVAECFTKVYYLAEYIASETGRRLPICFPKIGAGLGGGNWNIISTIIDETIPDVYEKHLYILSEQAK
jgi:O-acetyl-ADP-ribose deacetylase (regulator of RNase III)